MHHQDGEDLAEDVEVPPAAADIVQQRAADEEGTQLFWQPALACKRTRRIGDITRVDLVGRMHRVEERQRLRGQVRAHKGVVSLPHMLRDSAHELAHAPVHLLQHGQAR